jgi:hypothetical protein
MGDTSVSGYMQVLGIIVMVVTTLCSLYALNMLPCSKSAAVSRHHH